MQSYPSPSANAVADTPFYSNSGQQHSALSNAEQLRMANDLSRNLEPNMNVPPGGGMSEGEDLRVGGHMNTPYNHQPSQHAQHLPVSHNEPMDQMGAQYGTTDGSTAPRKRSKVSRACDECRRKKVKCDVNEMENEQCTNCRRVSNVCQFSRVPMKRGPSKGYIKELADRLHTLEGAMHAGEIPATYLPHHENPLQRQPSDELSPAPNSDAARKRTFSSVSGDFGSPYQQQRSTHWTAPDAQRHPPSQQLTYAVSQSPSNPAQLFREPEYSPNGLHSQTQWRSPADQHQSLRQPSNSLDIMSQLADHGSTERSLDMDDAMVEGYYNTIHPTYPILSQSKARLGSRWASCPPALREAFIESLYAAVRSLSTNSQEIPSTSKAMQLIATSQFDDASARSVSTNLVYLQTMILLAIKADKVAPSVLRGHTGSSRSVLLGSAIGLAYALKLHLRKQPGGELDLDSDDCIARRMWWSLIIMDRWHASSTSSPLLIPDSSVIVYEEDQALLGEPVYHLARLSIVLGHVSIIPADDLPPLAVPPSTVYHLLLRGELERWRESLPRSLFPPSNYPLVHLCYWHVRILIQIKDPEADHEFLIDPPMHIVTQLIHNSGLISPLTHHSTALATLTLIELTSFEKSRVEAESGLKAILESRIAPSSWDTTIREMISSKQPHLANVSLAGGSKASDSQHAQSAASQGLQRLADLATATEEGREVSTASEARNDNDKRNVTEGPAALSQRYREWVRSGYLSALGGEAAR